MAGSAKPWKFQQVPTRKPTRLNHIAKTPNIKWLHCHYNGSKSPIRGALTKPILSEGLAKRKKNVRDVNGCLQVPRCIDPVQWFRVVWIHIQALMVSFGAAEFPNFRVDRQIHTKNGPSFAQVVQQIKNLTSNTALPKNDLEV